MASELQHIDDFFRKKNDSFSADTSAADIHWQLMKDNLGNALPLQRPMRTFPRHWVKYAAILTIVISLVYLAKTKPWKDRSSISADSLPAKTNVPPNKNEIASSKLPSHHYSTSIVAGKKSSKRKSNESTDRNVTVEDHSSDPKSKTMPEADNASAFASFYNDLKKPSERFIIDTEKDTTIYCSEGSSIFIPASCFQSLSGQVIKGRVHVFVQEFYSIADIIGNKLTTLSDGRPLVTGGMLNIRAVAEKEEIVIRPGAAINLQMPTRVFDPGMRLFTGADESIAKEKTPGPSEVEEKKAVPEKSQNAGLIRPGINWIDRGQEQFFYRENRKNIVILNLTDNPYDIVYRNKKSVAKFRIPFNCDLTTEEIKRQLETKYGNSYDKIKVKKAWGPLFGKQRKAREWTRDDWYVSPFVGDSIVIPLYIACRLKLVSREDSLAYEAKWRKEYEEAVKRRQPYSEFMQVKDNYDFRISNLGWINCDRFYNYPAELTTFAVNTGEEFSSNYFQAILILQRENSAMPGTWNNGTISFAKLPVGEIVNVVCVGAKGGKVFSSIQTVRVSGGAPPTLQFKETTPGEFKDALARFGNVTRAR